MSKSLGSYFIANLHTSWSKDMQHPPLSNNIGKGNSLMGENSIDEKHGERNSHGKAYND